VEAAPADQGAAHFEQGFVDVVADLPAAAQPPEPVQQREALLDDPAQLAQPGAVLSAPAGDDRRDAEFAHQGLPWRCARRRNTVALDTVVPDGQKWCPDPEPEGQNRHHNN